MEVPSGPDKEYIKKYLTHHNHAIPLTLMESHGKNYAYFSAESQDDISKYTNVPDSNLKVHINTNYVPSEKHVIILGHNSNMREIMQGFSGFVDEWGTLSGNRKVLSVAVIDDAESLQKANYYREYPFVRQTVEACIFDREKICSTIRKLLDKSKNHARILILSDDRAKPEEVDALALANLVYVQEIIKERFSAQEATLSPVDIIVELVDPKHYDIVNSYSVNNIVISNRYISKMITQLGEKEALYDFYKDILTFDSAFEENTDSKEIYVKKVSSFFTELPEKCTAQDLIRAVFKETGSMVSRDGTSEAAILIGYVKANGEMSLFTGNQNEIELELSGEDKLLLFSSH